MLRGTRWGHGGLSGNRRGRRFGLGAPGGAKTYRLMSGMAASGEEGVDELTQQSKVVFSSTLTEPLAWANTRLMTGDAVEAVRAMKEDSRIELRTLGSVSLCRSLITTGWWIASRLSSSRSSPVRRPRSDLRRISRHQARPDREPHLRRRAPTVGVRAHRARRARRAPRKRRAERGHRSRRYATRGRPRAVS